MADELKKIDPIKVNEARERMQKLSKAADRGVEAAHVLSWLSDYVDGRAPEHMGFRVAPLISDHLVRHRNSDLAQSYLQEAAQAFKKQIAESAINMALADLATGDATKPGRS